MYKLIFGIHFHDDVKSAVRYIRNTLQAPIAANRLKTEIKAAYRRLQDSPFSGPAVPDEYDDDAKQINLVRFMYGPRNWPALLTVGRP